MTRKETPITVLVKLGSIAVHAQELFSPHGHPADRAALEQLLLDPEVKDWVAYMSRQALLPVKRN